MRNEQGLRCARADIAKQGVPRARTKADAQNRLAQRAETIVVEKQSATG